MQRDNHVHVAFVGNPNCGKTTLFNAITGSKLKVANWPGVTVEKYEGTLEYEGYGLKLVDTPGIYSSGRVDAVEIPLSFRRPLACHKAAGKR